VSNAFSGIPRLQRHQQVLARVNDLLPFPIHALQIKALAPDEIS
jgi:stress-induced morphogen